MSPDTRVPQRDPSVDSLRGLAALAVCWFHLTNTWPETSLVRASGSKGWMGVEVFFVLSGFIIPVSIWRRWPNYSLRDCWSFLSRRLVRIEVPYLTSILLVVALQFASEWRPGFAGSPQHYGWTRMAAHVCYLIPFTDHDWVQPVYWTLAWEFAFYVSASIILGVAAARPWGLPLALLLAFGGLHRSELALLFIAGCATAGVAGLAQFGRGAQHAGGNTRLAFGVVLAAALIGIGFQDGAYAVLAGCTSACLLAPPSVKARIFGFVALKRLGTISYSLYLVHVPIGGRCVNLLGSWARTEPQKLIVSFLALCVSMIAAFAFYRLVERPSLRLVSRISGSPSGAPGRPPGIK